MHHAFPRECQYPSEGGSVSRQSVEDWMRGRGTGMQTSEEDRKKQVDSDVCSVGADGKIECGDEDIELPWSPVEELMTPVVVFHQQVHHTDEEPNDNALLMMGALILVASVVSLAHAVGGVRVIARAPLVRLLAGVSILTIVLLALQNMLDRRFFALAACLSFTVYMVNLAVTAIRSLKQEKSLV